MPLLLILLDLINIFYRSEGNGERGKEGTVHSEKSYGNKFIKILK